MRLQDFNKFRDVDIIQPQRATLTIGGFSLPAIPWAGASVILAQFPLGNTYFFSFKRPIRKFGLYFVPAIRWVDENGVISRFVFWDDEDAVLFYPVYVGEAVGPAAILEIWSVNDTRNPLLSATKSLQVSVLVFPPNNNCNACCANVNQDTILVMEDPTILPPYAYGNPFSVPLEMF